MEQGRGYLLILIGVGLTVAGMLGVINQFIAGFGFIATMMGIQAVRASPRELGYAYKFGIISLILNFAAFTIFQFRIFFLLWSIPLLALVMVFFDIGLYFWILKAEYLWSPHNPKRRLDLQIFTLVAGIYFVIHILLFLPGALGINILPPGLWLQLANFIGLMTYIYYGLLIFIFTRFYLEEKNGTGGLKRWN